MLREATLTRKTNETDITVNLYLETNDFVQNKIDTGIGFFNHMLNSLALHGGFHLDITCKGDLDIDAHHSVEDCGIVLGQAFAKALTEKKGIARFGTATVPMDEALGWCSLDISGRPFLVYEADFNNTHIGEFDTSLVEEFMRAFAFNAGLTLHIKCLYGNNDHHKAEAMFKALAYALKQAAAYNPNSILLSAKGIL